MTTAEKTILTVEATINAPTGKVWELWTAPKHIIRWNNASDDWQTSYAENDLRAGGKFRSRMEAKEDGAGFDFEGEYLEVEKEKHIYYTLADGRKVQLSFSSQGETTVITEKFEADGTHPAEMQQAGWQAILNNFKKYAEAYDEMKMLQFEILIDAPVEKVFATMLDEKQYADWTAVFHPGSHFNGSWEKGSKILFLGPDEHGEMGGMVSRIRENIPNRFISIEHRGLVQNGREITSGEEVGSWAGALENYTFKKEGDRTLLSVEMDTNQEFSDYFSETWPKALDKLKAICEA